MDLRNRLKLGRPQAAMQQAQPDWYRISNAADSDDATDVYIYDSIGGWWGTSAVDFVQKLLAIDTKQINVHINSPGGDVFEGIAIFQALRNHPARIVTYVDSLAASAASFIAMAGDRRVVAPYGSVMIHDAWGLAIGNAADMAKMAEELDQVSNNIASIYAGRAGGDVAEWREAMLAETWYSAQEALDAGLVHEVQEDAEKGADDTAASNRWDLSIFNFAGRDKAPAPRIPSRAAPANTGTPDLPAAEPEPITEPKEEDPVSDLSEVRSRLGLAEDADETAIYAALDELKTKATAERQPDPAQAAAVQAQAAENVELRKEVDLLNAGMEAVTAELAATKAEKAASTKKAVLDEAEKAGKFKPADRAQWETDYDEAPAAVTRMLARIAEGTAVPVTATGYTGSTETATDEDAAFEDLMARLDGPTAVKGN